MTTSLLPHLSLIVLLIGAVAPTPRDFIDLISVTVEDACRLTGFPLRAIRRFISEGRVKSFRLGKRRYIDAASLRQLVDELGALDAHRARRPTPVRRPVFGPGLGLQKPDPDKPE
jgi:excisionase family DNA binding protein